MKATIDEQLFTEQVLESVVSIQKSDSVDFEIEKTCGKLISICSSGNVSINIEGNKIGVRSDGSTIEKYPGDIKIAQPECEKEIKAALEIAEKEIFEYDREEKSTYVITTQPRKIKKIITDSLCPSLLKTSDDVFEIAKSSTPVLLTLSLSGTISLPIQPVFFAAAAILLTRSSIAAICKDTHRSTPK